MANTWSKLMAGFRAATVAFREAYLSADQATDGRDWSAVEARRLRYDIHWAYFDNTAYRKVHTWSNALKAEYGLYRYTRGIYNPTFRLIEFHVSHINGGALDPAAGDGRSVPSALPIVADVAGVRTEKALRAAIAQLWKHSNWQTNKAQTPRYGSLCGDVALRCIDDPARQQVRIDTLHPRNVADLTLDVYGNVKGYFLEWERPDPRPGAKQGDIVIAGERAERDGASVVYTTTLDGEPFPWNGETATWDVPYGFVPLVFIKHLDVGLPWGWSELAPGLPKFREVDDLASKLHDQVRKTVDSPWLFAGLKKSDQTATVPQTAATAQRPEPGREEIPALYASDPNAKAHPLVAPLDIAGVSAEIKEGLAELERDYPELQMDIWTASGDASGRALRIARQRAESKMLARRAGYDDAQVRIQQMAVAIGGWRGYPGYQGFDLDSYAKGDLAHSIGPRPVFANDPLDEEELQQATLASAKAAIDVGMDPRAYLLDRGWSQERIDRLYPATPAQPPQGGGQ